MVSTPIMYIEDIYVEEEYRAMGIGKELYQHVQKIAKNKGCKRIELMVWEFNKNALTFYQCMGMKMQRAFFEEELV